MSNSLTPLTVTRQAPLSMGFCRILQADSLLTEPPGKPRSVGPESKNKEDFCLITANLTPFTCLTKVNNISTLSWEDYMEMAENTVVNWWPNCSCLSTSTLFAKWLHRLPLRGGLHFSVSWIWARFVTCHSQHIEEEVFMPLLSLGLMSILSG